MQVTREQLSLSSPRPLRFAEDSKQLSAIMGYREYVSSVALRSPSLFALCDFLDPKHQAIRNSVISYVQIEHTGHVEAPQQTDTNGLITMLQSQPPKNIVAIIEDVNANDIECLGSCLGINPFFFCGHIASSYRDIEKAHPPPLLALPPSRDTAQEFVNIQYQKAVDIGLESMLSDAPYDLSLSSNVPRKVRRLPGLSGRAIGLVRGCTSVIKHRLSDKNWICKYELPIYDYKPKFMVSLGLVFVDPATDIIVRSTRNNKSLPELKIPQNPRRIRPEDSRDIPSYAEFQSQGSEATNCQSFGLREELLAFFSTAKLEWQTEDPNILYLAHYAIQISINEWMLYGLLMSRYVKYYEYSFPSLGSRLEHFEKSGILDLNRWRRRAQQSIRKLQATRRFVEYWSAKDKSVRDTKFSTRSALHDVSKWDLIVTDLKYLEEQIDQHARSLEALNPIITSLVQLIDSRKSIMQAEDIKRLTYIAIAFVPLTYITGIFSMSEPYSPGNERFWVYWATALPISALIMGVLVLGDRITAIFAFLKQSRWKPEGVKKNTV